MKTIIAGSRTITDAAELTKALALSKFVVTEVVCGGARGADELGRQYAVANNIPVKMFSPDWSTYGPIAGPMRNTQMAEYAEAAIFLWDGVSTGTQDCIRKAEHLKLQVFIHRV